MIFFKTGRGELNATVTALWAARRLAMALCVMIATRKGNKWRQTRFDNSAAFATYSSGRKSARTFSIVEAASSAHCRFLEISIRFYSAFFNMDLKPTSFVCKKHQKFFFNEQLHVLRIWNFQLLRL